MANLDFSQIRLALMGQSKTGKTWSALTFPNPVVIDLDNNLSAHTHRTDVQVLPFWDTSWIKKWYKGIEKYPAAPAILQWLTTEALKLENDQTLFLDSWTTLQDAFDADYEQHPLTTKTGAKDDFGIWSMKIDYSKEICTLFKSLKCHVVVALHEQDTKDATGQYVGKIEPLMQGKFQKMLGLYFTDFFRCITKEKKEDKTDVKKVTGTEYLWQTASSNDCNLGGRFKLPMFCEAHYKVLADEKAKLKSATPKPISV